MRGGCIGQQEEDNAEGYVCLCFQGISGNKRRNLRGEEEEAVRKYEVIKKSLKLSINEDL